MKKRISNRENFSVLYLDLDNFKAYNDVYGFLKGDEIIKYTADTIVRCVHNYIHEGAFVGHIGGDDFIAIVPILNCDEICKNIIASFDAHVTKFFTEEDVEKGYIEVANRKGIIEQFPLTSISIGVVEADVGRFANMLEIGFPIDHTLYALSRQTIEFSLQIRLYPFFRQMEYHSIGQRMFGTAFHKQ